MVPLSLDLRERVVTAIREGNVSCRVAARQFKVSYASAVLWAQAMRERGSFAPLTMARRHPLAARGGARRSSLAATPAGTAPDAGRNLRAVGARGAGRFRRRRFASSSTATTS